MLAEQTHLNRPWVAPDICPSTSWGLELSSDLRRAIDRTEEALAQHSIGKVIHSLVAVRAALRSRLTNGPPSDREAVAMGPWPRRLRRRYAASLCTIERLLEQAWSSCDLGTLSDDVSQELDRLRRVESLENQAHFDQHWTDIGVGD